MQLRHYRLSRKDLCYSDQTKKEDFQRKVDAQTQQIYGQLLSLLHEHQSGDALPLSLARGYSGLLRWCFRRDRIERVNPNYKTRATFNVDNIKAIKDLNTAEAELVKVCQ